VKYKIEFQYKAPGSSRPDDAVQDEAIRFEKGDFIPIPDVGDSVNYMYGGKLEEFKVISRHFAYMGDWCAVTIVVIDISDEELASRLKM
jgi:hypothetical protein